MLRRFIQALLILLPLAVFSWLAWQEAVPNGRFVVQHAVHELSPFVDRLLPDARLTPVAKDADYDFVQSLIGDPVFFFVHPHRGFTEVEAEIWFKNDGEPIVELGGLSRLAPESYTLLPLQNLLLDNSPWPALRQGDLLLLQAEPAYQSLDQFLAAPPPVSQIATYHYSWPAAAGFEPAVGREAVIAAPLRGFHEFQIASAGGALRLEATYNDLNQSAGADPVEVLIYDAFGAGIASFSISDDGRILENAGPSLSHMWSETISALPAGIYKLEWRAASDLVLTRFAVNQAGLTVLNQVNLDDGGDAGVPPAALALFTEAPTLRFSTSRAAGAQTLLVDQTPVTLTAPFVPVAVTPTAPGLIKITPAHWPLTLNGVGPWAFSESAYFQAGPWRLTADLDLARAGVKYIIARYEPPEARGAWLVKTVRFSVADLLYVAPGTWKFVFSAPQAGPESARLHLGFINFTFLRPAFHWSDLLNLWRL